MKRLLAFIAASKLMLLAFVAALPWLWRGAFDLANFAANFHWPPDAAPTRWTMFATWDAQHYLALVRNGFVPGAVSNSFYPLWPLLMRLLAPLCGGSALAAGLLLSNLLSLGACAFFFQNVRDSSGADRAGWSVSFLLAYPGAFFLCLPYSESLFVFLACGLLLSLSRGRFGWAAAAMLLLPLSRAQGIVVAPAYWLALWTAGKRRFEDAALWAAPLLGVCADLGLMLYSTGDAFERFRVYRDVYHQTASLSHALNPAALLAEFFRLGAWTDIARSPMDRLWLVALLAGLPALWRKDRILFLYTAAVGLFPVLTIGYVSYTRYFLAAFPVFLAAADFLARKPPAWRWTLLAASGALQLLLLARHANNYWVA